MNKVVGIVFNYYPSSLCAYKIIQQNRIKQIFCLFLFFLLSSIILTLSKFYYIQFKMMYLFSSSYPHLQVFPIFIMTYQTRYFFVFITFLYTITSIYKQLCILLLFTNINDAVVHGLLKYIPLTITTFIYTYFILSPLRHRVYNFYSIDRYIFSF